MVMMAVACGVLLGRRHWGCANGLNGTQCVDVILINPPDAKVARGVAIGPALPLSRSGTGGTVTFGGLTHV